MAIQASREVREVRMLLTGPFLVEFVELEGTGQLKAGQGRLVRLR